MSKIVSFLKKFSYATGMFLTWIMAPGGAVMSASQSHKVPIYITIILGLLLIGFGQLLQHLGKGEKVKPIFYFGVMLFWVANLIIFIYWLDSVNNISDDIYSIF